MDKEEQFKEYSKKYNPYVYREIPPNKKILDLGCNTGLLGEALIKNKGCRVYGADYSKEAIKIARKKLNKVVLCDLEKDIPFKKEKFDIIILADIIEHLRYPEDFVLKLKPLLNKDGILIACIPNIANITIRIKLLMGKWDYKKGGILDRTHMRFFTKKNYEEFI
jgi:2-polyprenyl-3-methyl-5-hydroxy-6-metoxy-1,4-benzoquinol methylase